jgi:ribonuclease P/MRP protein subunit POP5
LYALERKRAKKSGKQFFLSRIVLVFQKNRLMSKIKPILPTLRERKRYLCFEIISKDKITDFSAVSKALWSSFARLLGDFELAKAGVMLIGDRYNDKSQRGILKVNNRYLNHIRMSFLFIDRIAGTSCLVRSVGVSGMIAKASNYL